MKKRIWIIALAVFAAILCLVVYLVGTFTCEKKEFYR